MASGHTLWSLADKGVPVFNVFYGFGGVCCGMKKVTHSLHIHVECHCSRLTDECRLENICVDTSGGGRERSIQPARRKTVLRWLKTGRSGVEQIFRRLPVILCRRCFRSRMEQEHLFPINFHACLEKDEEVLVQEWPR